MSRFCPRFRKLRAWITKVSVVTMTLMSHKFLFQGSWFNPLRFGIPSEHQILSWVLSGTVIGFPLFLCRHLTIPRTIHQPLRSRGLLQRLFRSSYMKIASKKKILLHKRQLHGFFNGISWSISGYVFRVIECTNVCFAHGYVIKEICKKISWRGDSRSIGFPCTDLWWCREVREREVWLQ